jgi:hypothetical protein
MEVGRTSEKDHEERMREREEAKAFPKSSPPKRQKREASRNKKCQCT